MVGWLMVSACAGASSPSSSPASPEPTSEDHSAAQPSPVDTDVAAQSASAPPVQEREPDPVQQGPLQPQWVTNTAAITDPEDKFGMPPSLLKDNIKTTAFTALVRITEARVDDLNPGFGYVNHVYRAEVLETFRGVSEETIEYRVMAERDIKLSLPDHPIIVSLCDDEEKGFYVPDNGYTTPAVKSLIAVARRVGRKMKQGAPTPACEVEE